jgi:hypothetical protein
MLNVGGHVRKRALPAEHLANDRLEIIGYVHVFDSCRMRITCETRIVTAGNVRQFLVVDLRNSVLNHLSEQRIGDDRPLG